MDSSLIEQGLHIKDYINVLRRRRDAIILFFVATVLVVTIGTFISPTIYRATVTILVDEESANVLTTSGTVALQPQIYYAYKEYYQSQLQIVASEGIIGEVFDKFNLAKSKEYKNAKEPLKAFAKTIKIEPIRDTRLFALYVYNQDPRLAAEMANYIAEVYVKRNLYYISRNEILNLLKNEYLRMETKLAESTKVYKEGHPEMIKLKKEMADFADKIQRAKKSTIDFDISADSITPENRYNIESLKANNISIQDIAKEPRVPIKPKKLLNILMGIIMGAIGGISSALFLEYIDDTIRDAKDVAAVVDWPFLGNLFKIGEDKERSDMKKELLVHLKPKDIAAEAYRAIRTAVAFSSTEEHPTKTIVITSPGPEEGKTITLCNLGIAMAQNNKKVLLIDSDMRKPRLHYLFNVKNDKGLSSVLSGQSELKDVIQKSEIENISLVTSGPYAPNPSELLSSSKIEEIIKTARNEFDFILFDTPPIIIVTDAAILSRAVDGIIIVLESEGTSKKILPQVDRIIKDTRMRLLGVIINKISAHSGSYYNYSYYSTP